MTNKRKAELYSGMLGYLVELTSGDDLIQILLRAGFTMDEIVDELGLACINEKGE